MKARPLCRISIETSSETEEAVTELLHRVFLQSPAAYSDARSGRIIVSVYLPKRRLWNHSTQRQIQTGLEKIQHSGLKLQHPRIKAALLKPQDWAESWKSHFRPLSIGSALLIKPSWSKRRPQAGQAVVVLDPGLSFGTGQHPTTGFCLRQLVRWRTGRQGQSLLDIGTGSGILAIAAAKLGYEPVEGLDNDPDSIRIAKANAGKNQIAASLSFRLQDLTRLKCKPAWSMVCANLTANLLLSERKRILACLAPDGILVMAGLLRREFEQVRGAYEAARMRLVASRVEKEWRSGAFSWKK